MSKLMFFMLSLTVYAIFLLKNILNKGDG